MLPRSELTPQEERQPIDGVIAGLGALALGIAAAIWFISRPDRHLQIGMSTIDQLVPAHYQISVFPAYGAMAALLLLDTLRGDHRNSWIARGALLAVTSLLAFVRLAGALPLSGHILFLTALLAHEATTRGRSGHVLLWVLGVPALLLASWYKLVVWHDFAWYVASLCAGAALGVAARWLWHR